MKSSGENVEMLVKKEGGQIAEIVIIVQEKDDVFVVGDRVRIIEGRDGTTRVRQ